ncbi:MAG: helix-turn-helix transcriptional regulator [Desulfitobacteriaceae bacterium]|nr:helix-turn-helix transcriptional regulator [Desulfitobacteriaceae bacterium]MDD4401270.1 helix-turn-helix transcriptional regulator [Desulfitobacteriaceae bacterium]
MYMKAAVTGLYAPEMLKGVMKSYIAEYDEELVSMGKVAEACNQITTDLNYCAIIYCRILYTQGWRRIMATSYNKLWKLLIDKKMSRADLRKVSGVSPNTMTKLRRDEPVMLNVLDKICKVLDVNYGDIVDYVADEERNDKS